MKLLMHVCCGPCTIYPLNELRIGGQDVTGFFYNPNIHPYQEYQRRCQTLAEYAHQMALKMIWADDYPLEDFLRNVSALDADQRCHFCLRNRLRRTVERAVHEHFDGFTTTLLYSIYQKHDFIREVGEELSRTSGLFFYYKDFRKGWKEGIRISKQIGMYRQQYCGCIYSEKQRYFKKGQL